LGGALTGGIGNGTVAALKGNNFWTGKDVKFGRTILLFQEHGDKTGTGDEVDGGSRKWAKCDATGY